MSTPTNPLDALIAAYVQAIEAGQVPDPRALLDRNPEHAEALQTFFNDFDRMDRVAAPLRIANESDETAALDGLGTAHPPTLRYFGDYELLEEVARGGMGIVYKARQTSLNRLVALKMILAGTFAAPREVARFQAEAEAAANLDHPHIVPVYEVGEHEGQQYFSMKFIEGSSLSNHPRAEPKAEVQGLITIARAVHHAHQHGVLHRDLKPSNVLVDPKGERHVTDFGLAKRLTDLDRSLTEAGQILGTPRYMSPEQAAGRKDLTVATDVYSLGVILYERLTGRTPFNGENVLTLLGQVRETEPPRPSSIHPGLDRDLETITLKCLEKDPTRRYSTAEDFAQDLARWLEGRPIAARPVGQAERFVRWCRRNPTVAGLAASVLLASVLGTVVSTVIALKERKERIRAEKAEDNTERTFARSLVRPLNPEADDQPTLSTTEAEALWELASEGTEALRMRVIDEAVKNPSILRQLRARSEPSMLATLGLDLVRREKASQVLAATLTDAGHPSLGDVDRAFLLLEIEDQPGPSTDLATTIIARAMIDGVAMKDWWERTAHMNPRIVAMLLTKVISGEAKLATKKELALKLAEVLNQLGPPEKAEAQSTVDRALVAWLDDVVSRSQSDSLSGIIGKLGPETDEQTCGRLGQILLDRLDGPRNSDKIKTIADQLDSLMNEMAQIASASLSARAVAALHGAMKRSRDLKECETILDSLSLLARWMAPRDSARARAQSADLLLAFAEFPTESSVNGMDGRGWMMRPWGVGPWEIREENFEPADGRRLAATLFDRLKKAPDSATQLRLAIFLQPLLNSLEPSEASSFARGLAEKMVQVPDPLIQGDLTDMLLQFSGSITPADAMSIVRILLRKLSAEAEGDHRNIMLAREYMDVNHSLHSTMASALGQTVERLGDSDLSPIVRELCELMGREKEKTARSEIAASLAHVVKRLSRSDKIAVAQALTASLTSQDSAVHLASVASYLSSEDILPIAQSLVIAIGEKDNRISSDIEPQLTIMSHIKPKDAARIFIPLARSVAARIERSTQVFIHVRSDVQEAASALSKLATRLSRDEAGRICNPVARALVADLRLAEKALNPEVDILALGEIASFIDPQLCNEANRFFLRCEIASIAGGHYSILPSAYPSSLLDGVGQDQVTALAREWSTWFCSQVRDTRRLRGELKDENGEIENRFSLFRLVMTDTHREVRVAQSHDIAATTLCFGLRGALMAIAQEAVQPDTCRLASQELVELLKMPTCIGDTRRVVLDQLGNIHGRRFFNHWEFVRFAREKGLKLDFTSPPRRPDPKASLGRLLEGSSEAP